MKIVLFFILLVSQFACRTTTSKNELKLVEGNIAETGLGLDAIVQLEFEGSPCSGMHLGNGYILTAAHCGIIAAAGSKPYVAVKTETGERLAFMKPTQYEQIDPESSETTELLADGMPFEIPVPDLSIIRPLKEADIAKIASLNKFALTEGQLSRGQEGVLIGGYGLERYNAYEVDGQLRVGKAALSDILEDSYVSFWRKENNIAGGSGGAPGDSGGPMFVIEESGRLALRGVASNILRDRDENEETIKVWTMYTRVDSAKTKSWIEGIITATNSDESSDSDDMQTDADTPQQDDNLADEGDSQFVGIYHCRSKDSSSPYYVITLDFNDERYVKVVQSRTVSATSEEVPTVMKFSEESITDYGSVLGIPHRDGGNFALYYSANPVSMNKIDDNGNSEFKTMCKKE